MKTYKTDATANTQYVVCLCFAKIPVLLLIFTAFAPSD